MIKKMQEHTSWKHFQSWGKLSSHDYILVSFKKPSDDKPWFSEYIIYL